MFDTDTQEYREAVAMAFVIWRGIDSEFKSQYKQSIYRIYEDALRSTAMQTNDLARFADRLCRRMQSVGGRNEEHRQLLLTIVQTADAPKILAFYRKYASLIVMEVRSQMQDLKQEWEEDHDVR